MRRPVAPERPQEPATEHRSRKRSRQPRFKTVAFEHAGISDTPGGRSLSASGCAHHHAGDVRSFGATATARPSAHLRGARHRIGVQGCGRRRIHTSTGSARPANSRDEHASTMTTALTSIPPPTNTLTLDDGRILAWDEHGEPGGFPVCFFHGAPGSRVLFPGMADAAATAGVRLLALDRPGCGRSSFQPGRRIADWPADVTTVADHLSLDRFAVCGVSGGGP